MTKEKQIKFKKSLRLAMNKIVMRLHRRRVTVENFIKVGRCPYCGLFLENQYHKNKPCKDWNAYPRVTPVHGKIGFYNKTYSIQAWKTNSSLTSAPSKTSLGQAPTK